MGDIEPLVLVLLGTLASGVLILVAVGMAYRLGRDQGLRSRSDRLDRLSVEADFSGTQWTVCDTSDAISATIAGSVSLHQSGTRVMADGTDSQNCRWSAEGVAFRRGVHLLFVERRDRGHAVGSVHLSLDDSGQTMTGMKSTWEGHKTGGAIQTVVWHRTPSGHTAPSAADVGFKHHSLATVANQQQCGNVFRHIDRLVTEVVVASPIPLNRDFGMHNR